VEVVSQRRDDVLLAPRAALRFEDDGVVLRLREGGSVPVVLGPCNASDCVLEQGGAADMLVRVGR